jgi:hypothetical protein
MTKKEICLALDEATLTTLQSHCTSHGISLDDFIQNCVAEKLEELLDAQDVPLLRKERTRPLSEVLKELN